MECVHLALFNLKKPKELFLKICFKSTYLGGTRGELGVTQTDNSPTFHIFDKYLLCNCSSCVCGSVALCVCGGVAHSVCGSVAQSVCGIVAHCVCGSVANCVCGSVAHYVCGSVTHCVFGIVTLCVCGSVALCVLGTSGSLSHSLL